LPDGGGLSQNATIKRALAPLLPNQTRQSCCFGHFIMKKGSSANAIVSDIS